MAKADLIAELKELDGSADADNMTVPELEAAIAKAKEGPASAEEKLLELKKPGGVTRRKVNRGSTRRLVRALTAFQKALDDFQKEIDMQVFVTDEDGNRTAAHPFVEELGEFRLRATAEINSVTSPE